MSNSTALVANITNIEEAAAAFGYQKKDGSWHRKEKATTKATEGKFGMLKRVHLYDDMEAHDGSPRLILCTEGHGARGRSRYLSQVDVTFSDITFPTDYREALKLDDAPVNSLSGGMTVTHVPQFYWMCFDATECRVTGFATGTFADMFERFVNATPTDLELSFRRLLSDMGPEVLNDLHQQAVTRTKKLAARIRQRAEAAVKKQLAEFNMNVEFIHDSLETLAVIDKTQAENAVLTEGIEYRCVFMSDHDSLKGEESGPVQTNWHEFIAAHAKTKRTHELAWAYRTVNKHKAPYAIWNPSAMLWELL